MIELVKSNKFRVFRDEEDIAVEIQGNKHWDNMLQEDIYEVTITPLKTEQQALDYIEAIKEALNK